MWQVNDDRDPVPLVNVNGENDAEMIELFQQFNRRRPEEDEENEPPAQIPAVNDDRDPVPLVNVNGENDAEMIELFQQFNRRRPEEDEENEPPAQIPAVNDDWDPVPLVNRENNDAALIEFSQRFNHRQPEEDEENVPPAHLAVNDDRDPVPLVYRENNGAALIVFFQRFNRRRPEEDEENEPPAQIPAFDLLALLRGLGAFKIMALLVIITLFIPPGFSILLVKFAYDYGLELFSLSAMIVTSFYTNQFVKEEAANHTNRDLHRSFWTIVSILSCVILVAYLNGYGQKKWRYLILMTDFKPKNLWLMLWKICIKDFILKFITIVIKLSFSFLPERILPFVKKGKFYFFIEALSQLYRSIVPIHPWILYLLKLYRRYEKSLSVTLSTAYIVIKGFNILKKANLLKTASSQLMKSSNLGDTPNEEQINSAGKMCPICLEVYDTPVLLSCSHIFCETCLIKWFYEERTCPLCRAQVIVEYSGQDAGTSQYCQLY